MSVETRPKSSQRVKVARRIIPCLDVRDGQVVKGVRFRDHEVVGDIDELALRYREQGADELVFYDITASPEGRSVDVEWIKRVNNVIDIPFCVAGGIKDAQAAETILNAGADKISLNSPALANPDLINQLAERFGQQCIVIGIDSIAETHSDQPHYSTRKLTGDPNKMQTTGRATLDWVIEVQQRGAGEIVLNCMDSDGVRSGYDIQQLQQVRRICDIPLIASGGAGNAQHFVDVFKLADVDGALAASIFHKGVLEIPDLKKALNHQSITTRLNN